MIETDIRPAIGNDSAAISRLSGQLGYPASVEQTANRLAEILEAGDQTVLVAGLGDESIVGWIHVFLARRLESGTFAEIGGLVIEEPHRRRGLGGKLVAAAEEWALKQGVSKLRVRTRTDRAEAHAFYERSGFQPAKDQRVFDKDLPNR